MKEDPPPSPLDMAAAQVSACTCSRRETNEKSEAFQNFVGKRWGSIESRLAVLRRNNPPAADYISGSGCWACRCPLVAWLYPEAHL